MGRASRACAASSDFAKTYDFVGFGETATIFTRAQQGTGLDKYLRQTLEEDAGKQNEGVRLALYFDRKAGGITSFYDVLADTALAKVVRTSLGLPDSFASADIDKQVQLFESKLDIADFSDPAKLSKFLTRFTSMWEVNNPTATPQSLSSVLFSQPTTYGISTRRSVLHRPVATLGNSACRTDSMWRCRPRSPLSGG